MEEGVDLDAERVFNEAGEVFDVSGVVANKKNQTNLRISVIVSMISGLETFVKNEIESLFAKYGMRD